MTAEEFKRLAGSGQLPGQTVTPKNIPQPSAPVNVADKMNARSLQRQQELSQINMPSSNVYGMATGFTNTPVQNNNTAPSVFNPTVNTGVGTGTDKRGVYDTTGSVVNMIDQNRPTGIVAPRSTETPTVTNNPVDTRLQINDLKNLSKEDKADFEKLNDFYSWLQDNILKNYQVPNANQGVQDSLQGYDRSIEGFRNDYSLENDPNYQAMADYNRRIMLQDAARRGMALSDNTFAQIEQAQALLGRDFMNDEYARRQQDINNRYGQVGLYNNLNNQNYNMAMQGFNTAQGMEQQSYNRGIDMLNREIANYGFELTPQTRELMNVAENLTPEQRQMVQQFEGNFAERMNQLDPSSQEYKMLNAARFNKILSNLARDPQTFGQYLTNDYGINPAVVGDLISQSREQNFQRELQTLGQYYNDFQQEINNREAVNPNDPLIPFLKIARNEKISSINESQMNQMERLQKNAMDLWKVTGVADDYVSEILGIPVGTQTVDFYDKQGRLKISEFTAQSGRINANASAQNALLNKQKFELQEKTSDKARSFLGEYLKYSQGSDLSVGEFLNSVVPQDEAYLESGGTQELITYGELFNNDNELKEFLNLMNSLNRIDKEEYNQYMLLRDVIKN
jgi:hypothetical protein